MMQRGDIWWADIGLPEGSVAGYRRPVLVIQADSFNESKIQTVIVIALTSNLRLADAPGNVLLSAQKSGLPKPSVVNVSQILTIDKAFLSEKVGTLPPKIVQIVEEGTKIVLDLF